MEMTVLVRVKWAIKRNFAWVHLPATVKDTLLLTFDDGPHPEHTLSVLKLLRRYDARAVFFVVGSRIRRAPHLLEQIRDEGHMIGNHSYAHPLGRQLPFSSYLDDVKRCQDEVERLTGETPRFFRPPLGVFSVTSMVVPRLLRLEPVLWSVNSDDLGPNNRGFQDMSEAKRWASSLAKTISECPKLNDIVLLHDEHPYIETILEPALIELTNRNCDLRSGVSLLAAQCSSNSTS